MVSLRSWFLPYQLPVSSLKRCWKALLSRTAPSTSHQRRPVRSFLAINSSHILPLGVFLARLSHCILPLRRADRLRLWPPEFRPRARRGLRYRWPAPLRVALRYYGLEEWSVIEAITSRGYGEFVWIPISVRCRSSNLSYSALTGLHSTI
jgi:hypothetical protein